MKPAQIFHQYIWIIKTLRAYRKMTLEELNQKWQEDLLADSAAIKERLVLENAPAREQWIEDDRVMSIVEAMAKYESGIDLTEGQLLAGYEAANSL